MDKENLGKFISKKRKALNLKQKDLANMLHISVAAVSKWETGVNLPDANLWEPISSILGVSSHELLNQAKISTSVADDAASLDEYMYFLAKITHENKLEYKKRTRKIMLLSIVLGVVIISILTICLIKYRYFNEISPTFKIISADMTVTYSESSEEEHICEVSVLTKNDVSHNDINEHLIFINEQWKIGKIANDNTDLIHVKYFSSENKDICIFDTYILKSSLQ